MAVAKMTVFVKAEYLIDYTLQLLQTLKRDGFIVF